MKLKIFFLLLLAIALVYISTFVYSRSWKKGLFLPPLYRINTSAKKVALTFDDGPSEKRTVALLQLLKEENIKATFFMVGQNIERFPQIARQVLEEGHLVGNHSYSHKRLTFRTPAFVRRQVLRTDSLIRMIGGTDAKYFRPPYSSKHLVLPFVLRSMNKVLVTGSYDPPSQYKTPYNAAKVAEEVVDNTEPGSIIYLHDGKEADAKAFIESVRLLIGRLKKKGYGFIRLDE